MINKKIIILTIFSAIAFLLLLVNSNINDRINFYLNNQKYNFDSNLSSFLLREEQSYGKKYTDRFSIYNEIKKTEQKYISKTDEESVRILEICNKYLDLYYDILTKRQINEKKYTISNDDYIFLSKKEPRLLFATNMLYLFIPIKDNHNCIEKNYKIRANLKKKIIANLNKRKINAKVNINDINFETFWVVYIDIENAPKNIIDYTNTFVEIISNIDAKFDSIYSYHQDLKTNLSNDNISFERRLWKNRRQDYWYEINKLDEQFKNRYIVNVVEKKKNGENILHLYTASLIKDGSRSYWHINYEDSNDFIKKFIETNNSFISYFSE